MSKCLFSFVKGTKRVVTGTPPPLELLGEDLRGASLDQGPLRHQVYRDVNGNHGKGHPGRLATHPITRPRNLRHHRHHRQHADAHGVLARRA